MSINNEQWQQLTTTDLLQRLINRAITDKASDIHIEPLTASYQIRCRHNGQLAPLCTLKKTAGHQLIGHIKVISKLNISEQRLPQDSHFSVEKNSGLINCRVSTLPCIYGEKVVIRVLNYARTPPGFEQLGMLANQIKSINNAIKCTQGLILITGPTGSGKTLTLYSMLEQLRHQPLNIVSIEDPVEIMMKGITQVNVQPSIGLSFSLALKALLRQDPDIIVVGEIRDAETAKLAVQAADTGHLVLATLHTQSSEQTIIRLLHLGIELIDLAYSLRLIINQRLLVKHCPQCFSQKKHCDTCRGKNMGRMGVFELLPVPATLNQHLLAATDIQSFQQLLRQQLDQPLSTTINTLIQQKTILI